MVQSQTATILVTDLVGSTELRVRLGEEAADTVRRDHDELMRRAIEEAGGTLVKGLGDGVLAMFAGAADAVSVAVAMERAAYAYSRAHPDRPLEIRIGISAGDITMEEDDCFGTPVVEASRLCAVAGGGQILAAELVRMLARGRGGHVFTSGGERELKGLPEPVPVVIVGWEPPELSSDAVPFPTRLTPQSVLPFSGRAGPTDILLQAWKETEDGDRRVVLVSGEPGVGKTRLAAEVARRLHDGGATVLFGRCDEDMGVAFQPFVEALEQVVASGIGSEALGRHVGELVRLVPDLARTIPGLPEPTRSDPETERYRLFDAVVAWLATTATERGVVLVLDDLHWAEKPTLLLLRHLVRAPEPMRLLVIGTYRDTGLDRSHPLAEVLADLRREPSVSRLALSGLDVAGLGELLAKSADERMDVRADELAQVLWDETEGNPFFVQEILRSLVESGLLVQRDGVWTTDFEIADLGIPEGIREVVGRRLSRLSEQANTVLTLASVIGSVVDVDVLVAVSERDEDQVLDALDEAMAASLVNESGSGTYEFTHALVRSTLYEELSATRRARRHRQVAEAMERLGLGEPSALAYHFRRSAALDERAINYAAAAGEQALERLAFDQAIDFFTQALESAEDLDAPDRRRCEIMVRLGVAQRLATEPSFRETLLEAARMARQMGDTELLAQAALSNSRGFWSIVGSLDEERVEMLEASLEAVGPGDSTTRARLLALLAQELAWRDPELRRFQLLEEAVAMARRLGDEECLLAVWASQHLAGRTAERTPALVAEREALIELAERVGNVETLLLSYAWGMINTLEVRDLDTALVLFDKIRALVEEYNNPLGRYLLATWRCGISFITERGETCEALALEAFELGQRTGQPDAFAWFAPQLFTARWAQGRLAEIVDISRQAADEAGLPIWNAALAVTLARSGYLDEAKNLVDTIMIDPALAFPNDFVWLLAQGLIGEAVSLVGTAEQAARQYELLLPFADRMPSVGIAVRPPITLWLGTLAARAGRREQAEAHFAATAEECTRLGAEGWAARNQLEWGRMALDAGASTQAATLLGEARQGAERMGIADVAAEAMALLATVLPG